MRDLIGRKCLPEIRQSEAAECGLACLAMVLGFHGRDIDLGTLRRRHPTSMSGPDHARPDGAGRADRLTARAVRLEPEQLGQLKLPAILHWEMDHFVVLTASAAAAVWPCTTRRGHAADPRGGSAQPFHRRRSNWHRRRHSPEPTSVSHLRLRELLGSLQGFGGAIARILVLSLLLQLYVLASPVLHAARGRRGNQQGRPEHAGGPGARFRPAGPAERRCHGAARIRAAIRAERDLGPHRASACSIT